MHKNDTAGGFPHRTEFATGAMYERVAIARGLDCWIYRYDGTTGARIGGVTTPIQVAMQLDGRWLQRGRRSGVRMYEPGMIHSLSPGERFDLAFDGRRDGGLVVGFNVYPYEFFDAAPSDTELVLDPGQLRCPALFDACREIAMGASTHGIEGLVREYLEHAADLARQDPIWRVKKLIDSHFASELYVEHLAEAGGLHVRALQRGFASRFGVSPVAYRLRLRLNALAREAWRSPNRRIDDVAAEVGFNNASYAHREFRRYLGTTPAKYRRAKAARPHSHWQPV